MQIKNILQRDYTKNQKFYQLKLPSNIEYMIAANDSVRLLSQFVEEMDLTDLYSTYSRVRENKVSPRKMLKIIVYAYMNKIYSWGRVYYVDTVVKNKRIYNKLLKQLTM